MASKYLFVNQFKEYVLPLPERISSVGFSELIFAENLHPNNYVLTYFLRAKTTGKTLTPITIHIKLDPMLPTKTNVRLLEHFEVGIGYEVVVQFSTLETPQKPDKISARLEYQVYF